MVNLKTLYFVIGDGAKGVFSYTWRVWWHGTSFYVKARNEYLGEFKVSMHGPDAFHPQPGFIVGRDQSAPPSRDTIMVERGRFLGSRFSGRPLEGGGLHVMTFRFGAELFEEGMPSVQVANVKRRAEIAARIGRVPGPGEVTDVHLFVTREGQRIPFQEQAEAADAILGPLKNKHGDILTGLVSKVSLERNPAPHMSMAPPTSPEDRLRGFGGMIDDDDRLWIIEQVVSKQALEREATGPE
jgi:hypothetical protein